ncbi:Hypothetical protein A7982_00752 [Minicystis rosea]|nr:Hypothetical protein A7982_00752 [Minicystis rosea]
MRLPRKTLTMEGYVRISCCLALVALAMIAWSLVHPQPLPVIAAMSVGQGLGTLSLIAFLLAVAADVRKARAKASDAAAERPDPPKSS